ncbi:MAG: response regulator transcription factor [Ferruginibacter sp.]
MPSDLEIRIIVADDHQIFRDGFKSVLKNQDKIVLVGEAANGFELLSQIEKTMPDVILTDIKMPAMGGIEVTKIISKRFPDIGVIALTTFNDDHFIIDMLEAGAKGFILKDTPNDEILKAIETVHEKNSYYCATTHTKLSAILNENIYNNKTGLRKFTFSEREKDIIRFICRGFSNKEISEKMNVSKRTVEGHRDRIMLKTDTQNIAGIVTFAIRHGIFEP